MKALEFSRRMFSGLKSKENCEYNNSKTYNTTAQEASSFKRLWSRRVGRLNDNNSVKNYKTRQSFIGRKFMPDNYPFRYMRNKIRYPRRSLYSWKCKSFDEEQQQNETDSYMHQTKFKRMWNGDKKHDVFFQDGDSVVCKIKGIVPFYAVKNVCHLRPSLYRWTRPTATKQQMDNELDYYMSQAKFNRAFNCENERIAEYWKDSNFEKYSDSTPNYDVYRNEPVSSFRCVRSAPYSRRFTYRWKREQSAKQRLDEELDQYMYEAKVKRQWNREKERQLVCYEDVNSVDDFKNRRIRSYRNSGYSRRPSAEGYGSGRYRSYRNIGYSGRHAFKWDHKPNKEQLDKDLDRYMYEGKLKRSWNWGKERQIRYEDIKNEEEYETSPNSAVYQIRPIVSQCRQYAQPWYRRCRRRTPTIEQLDDELDSYMSQVKLKRMWPFNENNQSMWYKDIDFATSPSSEGSKITSVVSPFRYDRKHIGNERQYLYRQHRYPTKEQLDDELDNYMAEVKFQTPEDENDDVYLFVQEYITEANKSSYLNETYDFV